MTIKNNKIVEATEDELFSYWLKQYSTIMDFTTYKRKMISLGVKIIENDTTNE